MTKRATPTRTLNPLHFEDLEPHRFEDLIRRLLYGFREWIEIEPTGRGGSDEGFDIRAWEKNESITNTDEEGQEAARFLQGNLWQVQGKREKSLSPARIKSIVEHDLASNEPPYGYILAAATNISKAGYDAFRTEARKKGVREFYFWGKDYLEDQLSLPDNDEILFTFFGISLSPRRKSRISEIKFTINNKNKLLRFFFGSDGMTGQNGSLGKGKTLLLRDIQDKHYPYAAEYPDFDKHRRWEEHDAVRVTERGVYFKRREWYAYIDREKKEWDFTAAIDLTGRRHSLDEANKLRSEPYGKQVEYFWRHLPLRHQAKLNVFGFVSFGDMLIIDDKGDPEYPYPHIFVDFGKAGAFSYTTTTLSNRYGEPIYNQELDEVFRRVDRFPKRFPAPDKGTLHSLDDLHLSEKNSQALKFLNGPGTLYGFDGELDSIKEGDRIPLPKRNESDGDYYQAEVTHVSSILFSEFKKQRDEFELNQIKEFAGRDVKLKDNITTFEVMRVMIIGDNVSYSDSDY